MCNGVGVVPIVIEVNRCCPLFPIRMHSGFGRIVILVKDKRFVDYACFVLIKHNAFVVYIHSFHSYVTNEKHSGFEAYLL